MAILSNLSPAQRRSLTTAAPIVVAVIGVALFVMGFALTNTEEVEPLTISGNPAIEALIPLPGAEVLRQSQVGVDLVAGFTAELEINGVPIPLDEVNVLRPSADADPNPDPVAPSTDIDDSSVLSTGRFVYQPLEGRSVPELKGDENCVVAVFWPLAEPDARERVEWCFTVA